MAHPIECFFKIDTGDDSSRPVVLQVGEDAVPSLNEEVVDARALDSPKL